MRTALDRFRRLFRRSAQRLAIVPLRPRGVLLAGAGAYVAFGIGRSEADYLLYPAGISAMALVLLCALCVVAGTLRIRFAVGRAVAGLPTDLDTTHPVRTEFAFPRLAWWPLVDTRMTWDAPGDVGIELVRARGSWQEQITPRVRGRHAQVVRRFTVEDVLGLTAIAFTRTWDAPLRIAPARATAGADLAIGLGHGDAFSHPSGRQEGDLVEMRAYGHGDPMRHILWKTFARSRRLLVRMPERAIAPRPATVAFLVAGPGDEPTCATARLYLEQELFGNDFVFCADGAAEPARERDAAIDQIIDSIGRRDDGGSALAEQVGAIDAARLGSCVVFAPAIDGAWRTRVTAFAGRLPSPPTVIIGVDGDPTPARRGVIARLLVRVRGEADPDAQAFADLPALRSALEADGMRVQVIHRSSGQVV